MTIERDTQIRALLAEQVARPRNIRFRTVAVTAVVAFALGGGVVGGALSATAGALAPAIEQDVPGMIFDNLLLEGGNTVGALATYEGSDAIALDLGERPADATGIAVYLQCKGTGDFEQLTGGFASSGTCDPSAGYGKTTTSLPSDSIVSITPVAPFEYTVWAQWISVPAPAAPSAEQLAAVADGKISDAERAAAIERFTACIDASGADVKVDTTGATVSWSGTNETFGPVSQCLQAELEQVEAIWIDQVG